MECHGEVLKLRCPTANILCIEFVYVYTYIAFAYTLHFMTTPMITI